MASTRDVAVGVVGGGPAGLLLSYLLNLQGVETLVLEARSRAHVEQRVRAGVCEHPTVELLRGIGVGARMDAQGMMHHGFSLRFDGRDHRIPLTELTGKCTTVYGQQEVVKDLVHAHEEKGLPIEFEVADVALHDLDSERPRITYTDAGGVRRELRCLAVAGCDGAHGVSRATLAATRPRVYTHDYPYAWLAVLARTPPVHGELIYANHERGFVLHSIRSHEVTRLYLQIDPREEVTDWPDDRVWEECRLRLTAEGFGLREGPLLEKSIAPMRSVVVEPMQYGRLFLAGDAAHIVPPTGAKGMNLAVADVRRLAYALRRLVRHSDPRPVARYSESCLERVWQVQHFSALMTGLLHRDPAADDFARKLQLARLHNLTTSRAAATSLAEHYVGLPFD